MIAPAANVDTGRSMSKALLCMLVLTCFYLAGWFGVERLMLVAQEHVEMVDARERAFKVIFIFYEYCFRFV